MHEVVPCGMDSPRRRAGAGDGRGIVGTETDSTKGGDAPPSRQTLLFPALVAGTPEPPAARAQAPLPFVGASQDRPSDRPTARSLPDPPSTPRTPSLDDDLDDTAPTPAPAAASTPSVGVIALASSDVLGSRGSIPELSASLLESVRDVEERAPGGSRGEALPAWVVRALVGHQVLARAAFVAMGIACVVAWRADSPPRAPLPRAAVDARLSKVEVVAATRSAPAACACVGASRALGEAVVGAGLAADVVDGEIAVGFLSRDGDAIAMRLDPEVGRAVETAHEKAPRAARRVRGVARRRDPDDPAGVGSSPRIDPLVDGPGRFTVASPGGERRELFTVGSWIGVRDADTLGSPRLLWSLPSRGQGAKGARARFTVARGAARDGGETMVAVREPSMLWLGRARAGEPMGPLTPLSRAKASLGTPAVAASRAGGYVAWAERSGGGPWTVMVARFDDGAPVMTRVASGMSPAIGVVGDGDLLVAWSGGPAGAHRVEARRLSPSLEPRGESFFVSEEGENAGQPDVAVRADGAGVVAYMVAETAGRTRFVARAAPVLCAVEGR